MNPSVSTPSTALRHPRGLYTLFFTEMWERCSYYGMRGLLVLFMKATLEKGGLEFSIPMAGAVYGLYTAAVYLAALPGGWVADRLLGAQRAVLFGGSLIACGQFTLAIPRKDTFFFGLLLVVLGTGMLKPNISAIVGKLYPEGGARRDAGFTIFYMGINLGSFFGPLICGPLGEQINWHLGFGVAGLGMIGGLVQFGLMRHRLEGAGAKPEVATVSKNDWRWLGGALGALALLVALIASGVLPVDPLKIANAAKWIIVALATFTFLRLFLFSDLTAVEKKRIGVVAVLFVAAVTFFAGLEQAGSSLNLFADQYTNRMLGSWQMPASWFQAVNPLFVVLLGPVAAGVWMALSKRGRDLSLGMKFGLGLLLLAVGYGVIAVGAERAVSGPVWPLWLLVMYLLHTLGELCVSPVGLSSITKLAPARMVGQTMGLWFMATALGNLMAGLIASESTSPSHMARQFWGITLAAVAIAVLLMLLAKPMRRWMTGIH
jgi:proton-dependent oligopeptide transporter, POT family